jgi:hypothetical protein
LASSEEQIESLLRQIRAGLSSADIGNDHIANSEQATILMAIEILLPHIEREKVNQMIANGGNALSIAKHYLLPEQMVSLYLDIAYSTLMDKAVREFDDSERYRQERG